MKFRTITGFTLALLIGIVCRLLDVPLPAPTALVGSLIVVSITLGYLLTGISQSRSGHDTDSRPDSPA